MIEYRSCHWPSKWTQQTAEKFCKKNFANLLLSHVICSYTFLFKIFLNFRRSISQKQNIHMFNIMCKAKWGVITSSMTHENVKNYIEYWYMTQGNEGNYMCTHQKINANLLISCNWSILLIFIIHYTRHYPIQVYWLPQIVSGIIICY